MTVEHYIESFLDIISEYLYDYIFKPSYLRAVQKLNLFSVSSRSKVLQWTVYMLCCIESIGIDRQLNFGEYSEQQT